MLKWLYAFYLYATGLKGVSSLKLHCGIDVSQKTAWFVEGSALPEDEARDFATDQ
ncbi:MAG: hypothetical protein OXI96_09875 [Acidimicrobiaceae bacterium]|nr:hypothetical protein [Acidimicrobiaceae bacterium]